jgi:integrase/recombinase XerD
MLSQAVDHYLAVRRAAGFTLRNPQRYLQSFVSFANSRGETCVRVETAIAWAALASTETERAGRLRVIRLFSRFMHAEELRHELLPEHVFCSHHRRPTAYILSDDELRRLIVRAQSLGPPGSLTPHTYSTLITLLAVTGLRPAEALALRFSDLTEDGLVVRETKFRKSRLVPLHETTQAALQRYLLRRRQIAGHDDHLFISLKRHPLTMLSAARTFRKLLQATDLRGRHKRLRLHSLRHRFATRALERCPHDRDQVSSHIVALSTYLGHVHLEGTYWYLETTPQLMTDIAERCESFLSRGVL